jgi:hypothetical protein
LKNNKLITFNCQPSRKRSAPTDPDEKEDEEKGIVELEADPRFSALFADPRYAIDKSHPAYKAGGGIILAVVFFIENLAKMSTKLCKINKNKHF